MTEGIYDIKTGNKQNNDDILLTVLDALANMKLSNN
jgi:hypothetical protein